MKRIYSKNLVQPVRRINVITMGCSKNLVDSEVLMGQMERSEFEVYHDAEGTGYDAVIINTCGFIHDAKQESIDMILQYADAKLRGEIGRLYVMGCLSQRYMKELEHEIPEVDRYFGKFDIKAVTSELNITFQPEHIHERKITTPSYYSYLKISEGCSRTCAFCAIPLMTGKYKSVPVENLVSEAEYLSKQGVRELLLIAQDLSYYGKDIYGKNKLSELTGLISAIDNIEWIRLHYLYPSNVQYDLADVMLNIPKVCKYLDIPLQHISDPVLKRMRRRVTRSQIESIIEHFRKRVGGISLRTTMMVGFPGETEADFEELKKFIIDAKFERLGVFSYSHEEGTFAARKYEDNIPGEVKQARAGELMEIQRGISAELNNKKIGMIYKVIIDRKEGNKYVGRTEFDSPEVDGEVYISSGPELETGSFYQVKITGADEYDLYGHVLK